MKQCNNCGIDKESYDEVFRSPELEAIGGISPEWKEGSVCPLCERDFQLEEKP